MWRFEAHGFYEFVDMRMLMLYSYSVAKRVESAMTTFSIIWWIIGFYWVTTAGRQNVAKDSPQLYWFVWTYFSLMCYGSQTFIYVYRFTCCFALQALYCISCCWHVLCNYLHCCCMPHWYCCLLLPTLYNRHLICYGRPGKKNTLNKICSKWTGDATTESIGS